MRKREREVPGAACHQALTGVSLVYIYIQESRVPKLIPSLGRPAASLAFCALDGAFQVRLSCAARGDRP